MKNGYHLTDIPKGTYGEISKIKEEVLELEDAAGQGVRIMVLMELSDLVCSINGFLRKKYPGMSINDLVQMANVTERAFSVGERSPNSDISHYVCPECGGKGGSDPRKA